MALAIRLSRGGSKKRPYYRIVVADARSPRDGKFIERIGSYNPLLGKDDANRVILNGERAKHWLAAGAQPSDRVARFLDVAGVKERAAKAKAGLACNLSVREGVQMHGGIGMTDEYDIGLYMKRDRSLNEFFGDAYYHADRVATMNGY